MLEQRPALVDTIRAWTPIGVLGLVTITAYGCWFYAYGVLIDPIATDTGWSQSTLGAVYAGAQLTMGLGSSFGGRLLDKLGGAWVFGIHATVGAGLLALASFATNPLVFGICFALGGGTVGACGFYHVTTTAASRIGPGSPARSISVLTMIGAFCSPIYLPMTAWLVGEVDWRVAMRILASVASAGALVAAVVVSGARAPTGVGGPSPSMFAAIRVAARERRVRLMLLTAFASGIAYGAILVYQVPILVSGGLGLTTAATMGGVRGACQFLGRVGIIGTTARFGARRSLVFSYATAAVGVSAMLWGGSIIAAGAYAVLVGVALGAVSPLQAIYGEELYPASDLGALLGVQSSMVGLAGAAGPLAAGIMVDHTGGHIPTIWLGIASLLVASFALSRT